MLLDDTIPAQEAAEDRRMAAIDRLRAAVARLDDENRALRAEVAEFTTTIHGLGARVEALEDAADEYRFELSLIRVSGLRRNAQRLGETADNWLTRFAAEAGETSAKKVRTAA